jgi:hypothetical protein
MFAAPPVRWRSRRALAAVFAALVGVAGVTLATSSAHAVPIGPPTHLKAAGPTSGDNGYPVWYKDSNNLSVSLCLDGDNPLCGFLPGDIPNPDQPISFPDNYPDEAFYMLADSTLDLPSGPAVLTTGLESAFSTAGPEAGGQITFGRVRIRITTPNVGHFTVTHPYGVDEFDVTTVDTRNINFVEDIGVANNDFTGVLESRIDPFLRWDTGFFIGPDGASYLGDPSVPHQITGSTLNTNFFKIEGPNIGGPGIDVVQQNLFTLQGKVATNAGIAPQSVTYTQTSASGGFLDVFGSTQPEQSIEVKGSGVSTTRLRGDVDGRYFGRVAFTGSTPPPTVKVINASDRPRTEVEVTVTDQVQVTSAEYDTDTDSLVVKATSSDTANPPVLTVPGFGALNASGTGTFNLGATSVPPATVTVTSSRSGADTAPVIVTGAAFAPEDVVAQTPPTVLVQQGQQVLLDGSATQNATSYAWTQESGTPVTIANASSAVASFTAPAVSGTLTFRLTAQGPGGPSTADSEVTVQSVAPPIANAGVPQSVLQGARVTLDASGSQGATSYAWTQIGGTNVALTGAATVKPTFTMPLTTDPLVFQVTATGPGGSDVASVQVSPLPDALTVDLAEYRTSKGEWRISGTSGVTAANNITVWLGPTPGAGAKVNTTAVTVDALGVWSVRFAGPPNPGQVRTISVTSSRGGSLAAVPLNVRR